MPADFTINSVQQQDQWSNDYGTYQSYDLVVTGLGAPNTPVSLNRKLKDGAVPQDKIPQQGQTLYLEIQGTKAKEVQRDEQSPSNGSSGAVRTDVTGTSIEAQVAAKCCADVLELSGKTRSQVAESIEFLTLCFFDSIQKAKRPDATDRPHRPPSDPTPEAEPVATAEDIPF